MWVSTTLRAEFLLDEETGTWHFRVPVLRIVGGGTPDRAEAERLCVEAVEFALEGDPAEYDPDAQAVTLDVVVSPAA